MVKDPKIMLSYLTTPMLSTKMLIRYIPYGIYRINIFKSTMNWTWFFSVLKCKLFKTKHYLTKVSVEVKSTSPSNCLVRHISGVFTEKVILTHTYSGKSYEFLPGNKRKIHRVGVIHSTLVNACKSKYKYIKLLVQE